MLAYLLNLGLCFFICNFQVISGFVFCSFSRMNNEKTAGILSSHGQNLMALLWDNEVGVKSSVRLTDPSVIDFRDLSDFVCSRIPRILGSGCLLLNILSKWDMGGLSNFN